ncbi:nitrilase-related carbon-nitrogen hydrolase [Pseudomonas mohnii]
MKVNEYTVAAVQFEPVMFEKERNILRLGDLVQEAAGKGAKLIVTPEMGTTGYCWFDRNEVEPMVETVPGKTTAYFQSIAEAHDCYIVIGMPEVDPTTNLYYNAAVLIGPDGVVGCHRKTHPYIAEPKWAASGDKGHQVYDTPIGRIAILICMDIHFVETARLAGLGEADVICHVSAWLAERTPAPYWISRAMENGCYLLESNRWGLERTVQFSGGSCLIEPNGNVSAAMDTGDGIVYGTVDLSQTQAASRTVLGQKVFQDRRPDLYSALMTNTYSWNPVDFFNLYGRSPLPQGRVSEVGVAQFEPSSDIENNLQCIEALVASSACQVLVFPELAITGASERGLNRVSLGGPEVERLMTMATRYQMHIVAGLAEQEGAQCYNSAVLVGPEGLVGCYRQIHVKETDRHWASPGDQWASFDIPAGRIGIMIGYDAYFPESGRVLSIKGSDLIACPSSESGGFYSNHPGTRVPHNYPIPTGATPYHWHHYRVRAGENNVFLAFANACSKDGAGASGVFGPNTFEFPRRESIVPGDYGVASISMDTTESHDVYSTNIVRRKDLMVMRLPHHYLPLVYDAEYDMPEASVSS